LNKNWELLTHKANHLKYGMAVIIMWKAISHKLIITAVVFFTVLTITGLQFLMPMFGLETNTSTSFRIANGIIFILDSVLIVALNFYWKQAWERWPILGHWIFPNISGRWSGQIKWSDQNGAIKTKPINIHISQSWLCFKVALETDEAYSKSTHTWIEKDIDLDTASISYIYDHTPSASKQGLNPPHQGTATIVFHLGKPKTATGRYYTSRCTTGDINLDHETT